MGKKHTPGKVSKRQQAHNQKRGLKELWIDGCFFNQENKAGGAGVICSSEGKLERVLSFELNHLHITESDHAELWNTALVLQAQKPDSIGRITSDCPAVINALEKIRAGKSLNKIDEELSYRLTLAVNDQPSMAINKVTRGQGKIPLADSFAKAAAHGDTEKMAALRRTINAVPHDHFASPARIKT